MTSASVALQPATDLPRPSQAQARIIAAASRLFAQHGVGGTSLQMIADEIGVTKAAVYHQYNTKEEIVRAVAEAELARLEDVLDAAEACAGASDARDTAISGIVDLAIERRRLVSPLLNDPVIGRLFAGEPRLLSALDRLSMLLMGSGTDPESRVATVMLSAAISGAIMHPLVVDQDDERLRTQLQRLARRFLDLERD